jgi:hypothetical protein
LGTGGSLAAERKLTTTIPLNSERKLATLRKLLAYQSLREIGTLECSSSMLLDEVACLNKNNGLAFLVVGVCILFNEATELTFIPLLTA